MKTVNTVKTQTATNAANTLTKGQKAALTRKANIAAKAAKAELDASKAASKAEDKIAAVEVKIIASKPLTQQEKQELQKQEFLARTGKTEADIQVQPLLTLELVAKVFHSHGYKQVTDNGGKSGGFFRSLTVAAHIYAGFIELKGGLPVNANKGNFAMLKLLLSTSAPSYWRKIGAYNKELTGMSVIGINKIADSLNVDKGTELRAQPKIIAGFLKAFKAGGKQVIEGRTIQFYAVSKKQLDAANK